MTPRPNSRKDLQIEIEMVGPAALHNLLCWICQERKAVYHMYPTWCFGPCWECDAEIGGRLERTRRLPQRLKSAFRRHNASQNALKPTHQSDSRKGTV